MFEGYRALGYYASAIPFSVVKSDEDILIASSVGQHAFYVYDSAHLNLAYMSKYIPEEITWIQTSSDGYVYTALQSRDGTNTIVCWKKMHQVMQFEGHAHRILKFLVEGEFLFSLAEQGEFLIFSRTKGKRMRTLNLGCDFDNFIHPTTYVNKLLLSGPVEDSEASTLQLWNIMTEEKIFEFTDLTQDLPTITCIEQSPVVDVVALGFQNGEILLVNILYNELILRFSQSQDGGSIKTMSFSSDIAMGISLLASVTDSRAGGQNIVFWDLN